MKIYIEHDNKRVSIEDSNVVVAQEAMMVCRDALVALGYHPTSVMEAMMELCDIFLGSIDGQCDCGHCEENPNADEPEFG